MTKIGKNLTKNFVFGGHLSTFRAENSVFEDEREGPDHRCGPKVVRGPMNLCGPKVPSLFLIFTKIVVTSLESKKASFCFLLNTYFNAHW